MKFLYISIIIFLISLIFLFVQGIKNNKFFSNDRQMIVERLLYEQFAQEVYASINSKILFDLKQDCENDENIKKISLNLDTYFDCRGIYNSDLHKDCQNQIINNYTKCPSDRKYTINMNNLENELDYDERAIYCKYYSKFKRNISTIYDISLSEKKSISYNYEHLLSNSISPNEKNCPRGYKKCGILDTKKNILCLDVCPNNIIESKKNDDNMEKELSEDLIIYLKNNMNSDIIVSIIISENQPLNHEFNYLLKMTHTKLKEEEKQIINNITGEDYKLFDTEYDNTYKLLENSDFLKLKVKDFQSESNNYNSNQKLNVYTRNYIGFKNLDELKKFKEDFKSEKLNDNPLYKLSSSGHKPLITIIFSVVFFIISLAYIIVIIINKIPDNINEILFKIFFAIEILFWLAAPLIIVYHFIKYNKINIDMDERMKVVLDKYNKRRIDFQLFRIISWILNTLSLILLILFCKNNNKHNVNNNQNIIDNQNSDNNNIINNNNHSHPE